jgi:hypothetical protein
MSCTSNYALGILQGLRLKEVCFERCFLYRKSLYLELLLPKWSLRGSMIGPKFAKIYQAVKCEEPARTIVVPGSTLEPFEGIWQPTILPITHRFIYYQ